MTTVVRASPYRTRHPLRRTAFPRWFRRRMHKLGSEFRRYGPRLHEYEWEGPVDVRLAQ